jgi:hypothetical protein
MTESKKSHWKSIVSDFDGTELENPADVNAESETSNTDLSTEPNDIPVPIIESPSSEDDANIDVEECEIANATEESSPKKKKRGSWAFWRSGNKGTKGTEADHVEPDSSKSEDPLALLNQAETTDDMASAIDQLFAGNNDDDVVFDAEEIATSIDFDDERETTSRDSKIDDPGRDRGPGRRNDRSDDRSRSQPDGARSRNDRSGDRSRDERGGDRSRNERGDDRSRNERGDDRSRNERGDDRSRNERGDDRSRNERDDNRSRNERGHDRSRNERGDDRSRNERGDDRSRNKRGDDRSRNERGDDRSRNERGDDRSRNERGDDRSRDDRVRKSDRNNHDEDSRNTNQGNARRVREKQERPSIDHGEVPTWDKAVSFVVDNNMVSRERKSDGKNQTKSRSRR